MNRKQKKMLSRILAAAVLLVLGNYLPVPELPRFVIFLVCYVVIGYDIVQKAYKGVRNGRPFDECFLMAVATIGAFALAVYGRSGDYNEAVFVMFFYQVGEFFQSYAVGRSRRNITELMDIRPDYANVEADGVLTRVDPDEVEPGTIIVVQPGEKVPIDGIVVEGRSSLNTSALTGESLPREVNEGDDIISGSINLTGVLHVKTTKAFEESTVSKILELVEDSASHKSKSEDFIARFARVYTPAVCYGALALALLPPLAQWLVMGVIPVWDTWVYRALTFLVISCPCALVVSIPLSFFAGIGGASREGILVKGANMLETLSKVSTVVLDKTGTLTLGVFEVTAMHGPNCEENPSEEARAQLLEMAALAECASSHPIAKSLIKAYERPIDHSRVCQIEEVSGHGIKAMIDGRKVAVGNEKLMQAVGADYCHCHTAGTIVHVAHNGQYAGHIILGDVVKPHAKEAIEELHKAGVGQTVMLTGDTRTVAEAVTAAIGLDAVYSELLPADKVARVEAMIAEAADSGRRLAFVGDGINDAPVLSRADIGIAMGGVGSDAAIEAADVVLMDDDPLKIAKAIRISRKTLGIVWQNIIMALGVKGACLVLGAFGIANMWLAIFADVGIMIIAVLNAIRAMYVKNL